MKRQGLPKILVTGASGIIGRNLINDLCRDYQIYALARRTQQDADVLVHKNIKWILVDIAAESSLAKVIRDIANEGGVDFVIHLAAYYDFGNEPHPEYERTNVQGTRLMLEHARGLGIKRFVYASSIAACRFLPPGEFINESRPLDAEFPYAIAKRKCEDLLRQYSEYFPCVSLRLAAVFTDWCEFGPLYMFFNTWLSSAWNSRIIAGQGQSAIPYVHIQCVSKVIDLILEKTDALPRFDVYVVSSDSPTSHYELYELATRLYFGEVKPPVLLPKFLAAIGVYLQDWLGRLIGKRPFVRPWMLQYIDLKLNTESAYTRKTLGWAPPQRSHILRRLLFLIENLKSSPLQWHQINAIALKKTSLERPNLILAELMQSMHQEITELILQYLTSHHPAAKFRNYRELQNAEKLKWYIELVYNLLIASVRSGDRFPLVYYARALANIRSQEGFDASEVCQAMSTIGGYISSALLARPETRGMEMLIHDRITLTIQLYVDELEDSFERIALLKKSETRQSRIKPVEPQYKELIDVFFG